MDTRKRDEVASQLDELVVEIEELKEGSSREDAQSLEDAQTALERASDALENIEREP